MRFHYRVFEETARVPGRGARIKTPAQRIRAVFIEHNERIYYIAFTLAHLNAVLILYKPQNDNIFIRRFFMKKGGSHKQTVKPAASLVNGFTYKIGRKILFEFIFIFEWIMPLRRMHHARIEPAVDNFRHALHLGAATASY